MSTTWFNDTFTESATTALTSHTSDSGSTWSYWAGDSTAPSVYNSNGGVVASGSTNAQLYRESVIATAADVSVPFVLRQAANTGGTNSAGVAARLNAGATAGYLAVYQQFDSTWRLFRLGASLSATQLASASMTLTTGTDYSAELRVTGSGATVTVALYVGGTLVTSYADTDAARVTAAGYIGVYFSTASGAASRLFIGQISGATVDSVATVPGAPTGISATAGNAKATINGTAPASDGGAAITSYTATATPSGGGTAITASNATFPFDITGLTNGVTYGITVHATNSVGSGAESSPSVNVTPLAPGITITSAVTDGRIFRHSATTWSAGATGSIVETGTYSNGTPNQIRLVQDGTNTAVSGFDWMTIGSATGGNYSHTFTSVPQGWYNVQFRDSAAPTVITSTGKRGVGIYIGHYGQSQSTNQFDNFPLAGAQLTPTGMSRVHGGQSGAGTVWNWAALDATKNSAIVAADILLHSISALANIPIAFLNMGYPGTSLVRGGTNGNWLPLSGTLYQYGKTLIAGIGGKVDVMVDTRGESDANNGTVTQAEFYSGLGTLYTQTRTDCGNANLPIVTVMLGGAVSYWTDAAGEAIKQAQAQRATDANTYRVESYDAPLYSDGLHRNTTGDEMVARRWAQACAVALGVATAYRSPRIASVAMVNSTTFDVSLTHGLGTDFTPTSAITGLTITDSVSGAALTATAVTHQAANKIRFVLSAAPSNMPKVAAAYGHQPTTNFADNSALALPLEYTTGVVATSNIRTVTLTLGDTSGPLANLSGLMVAFFEQPSPDLFQAPIYQTSAATTNSSGVLTFSMASALSAGGTGAVIVRSTAGQHYNGPVVVS